MTYAHEFRVLFTVHGSERPDGMDLGGEAMLKALKARVAEFEANPQLLRDLAGAPQSSKTHSPWVLRKIGVPGMIRQSDGGWITVEAGNIRPEDQLRQQSPPPRDGFWCRVEDAFDAEVLADMHSDDHVIMAQVNIAPWLASADVSDIQTLEAEGWGYDQAADHIAYALEDMGDPGAARLFSYLGLSPKMSFTGDPVGFSLSVLESDALDWLKDHRPEVHEKLKGVDEGLEP